MCYNANRKERKAMAGRNGQGGKVFEVYSLLKTGLHSYIRSTELLITAPADASREEVTNKAEALMSGPGEWEIAEWNRLAGVPAGVPVYCL
jgi:hypothetical protein